MREPKNHEERTVITDGTYLPEAIFINLKTQEIESIRPDELVSPEQYILLSDLLAIME